MDGKIETQIIQHHHPPNVPPVCKATMCRHLIFNRVLLKDKLSLYNHTEVTDHVTPMINVLIRMGGTLLTVYNFIVVFLRVAEYRFCA